MKGIIINLLFGKDGKLSGIIALAAVAFIALGCACGDLAKLAENDSSPSNTSRTSSDDPPFGDDKKTSDGSLPSDSQLKALVADTTAEFAKAISENNFDDLYEKASMDFKSTYTQSEMEDVFKEFIKNKRVVAPILAEAMNKEPQFSPAPYTRTEKGLNILVANGKYATKRVPTNFEYEYVFRDGEWQLLKLIVKLQ